MTRLRWTALRFAVFVVACAVVLVVLTNTMSNQVSGDTQAYAADFTNVSGLRPGDDVRAAGVKVGRVGQVSLHGDVARVSFELSRAQPVYTDTRFSVRYQNLLGQRYLTMLPGKRSDDRLRPGSVVPVSRTEPGFDLTALLNGFEPLFSTLEPKQVNRLSASIVAVMQGQGGNLEALLSETASLSEHLADKDEVLGRVLDNLTPVLRDVAARGDEVDRTVSDLRALMTSLAKERTSIGDSIDGVSDLSDATASLVAEARKPLAKDVRTLREFGEIGVAEMSRIRALFGALPAGTASFARPMSHGTWLNLYICNMAIDLPGASINIGGPAGPYSPACR